MLAYACELFETQGLCRGLDTSRFSDFGARNLACTPHFLVPEHSERTLHSASCFFFSRSYTCVRPLSVCACVRRHFFFVVCIASLTVSVYVHVPASDSYPSTATFYVSVSVPVHFCLSSVPVPVALRLYLCLLLCQPAKVFVCIYV